MFGCPNLCMDTPDRRTDTPEGLGYSGHLSGYSVRVYGHPYKPSDTSEFCPDTTGTPSCKKI